MPPSHSRLATLVRAWHGRTVRFPLRSSLVFSVVWLVGIFFGGSLCAQEQERKLMDRINRPDLGQSFDLNKSAFGSNRTVSTGTARIKGFFLPARFRMKSFQSKDFAGSKASQYAGQGYATAGAPTRGKYEIPNAKTKAATKTQLVSDARESSKSMSTARYAPGDAGYKFRGRSQDVLDKEHGGVGVSPIVGYGGDMRPLSIDDVRDLLNKNK
jgi:hypothetical protein